MRWYLVKNIKKCQFFWKTQTFWVCDPSLVWEKKPLYSTTMDNIHIHIYYPCVDIKMIAARAPVIARARLDLLNSRAFERVARQWARQWARSAIVEREVRTSERKCRVLPHQTRKPCERLWESLAQDLFNVPIQIKLKLIFSPLGLMLLSVKINCISRCFRLKDEQ